MPEFPPRVDDNLIAGDPWTQDDCQVLARSDIYLGSVEVEDAPAGEFYSQVVTLPADALQWIVDGYDPANIIKKIIFEECGASALTACGVVNDEAKLNGTTFAEFDFPGSREFDVTASWNDAGTNTVTAVKLAGGGSSYLAPFRVVAKRFCSPCDDGGGGCDGCECTILGADGVDEGSTITLRLSVGGSSQPYAWSSGDESVATVDALTGEVFGVHCGTVTITATDAAGCVATKDITVTRVCAGVFSVSEVPECAECDAGTGDVWDGTLTAVNCFNATNTQGTQTPGGKDFLFAIIEPYCPTVDEFDVPICIAQKLSISCLGEAGQLFWIGFQSFCNEGGGIGGVYVFDSDLSSACYAGTPTITVTLNP